MREDRDIDEGELKEGGYGGVLVMSWGGLR